ncbi:VWA domain-containing protein [Haloferula sargassicola]|uniref:Aerotolerance regulator N-terminal domain-containing protein n=1 Tax=Haloferula sargassicola TaxID=490096 RepID=A0ABP9UHD9_9BACT
MSVFLQHPALLGLLALAGLPLLAHLLARAKPPVYRFSNVEFLRKVVRLTSRFKRPKDWLLLALRTLALLALASAFLGPLLLSENAPLPGEKRTIVCLIDRSGSMAASAGGTSRFDAATAMAAELLESADPERANVVWIDSRPDAVFPEPGPNLDFLVSELGRVRVSSEANAIDAAFELALRQFAHSEGRRELHVFSDFQASAWEKAAPAVPDSVQVRFVPVGAGAVPNVCVASLVPLPAAPVAGRDLVVQCRLDNHSPEPRHLDLTLDAGGSRQSQPLDLPANGSAEASFRVRCGAAGLLPLTAGVDGDAFTADDQRHAVVRVRESLKMAIAGKQESPAASTLQRVAASLPWLDTVPAGGLNPPPACDLLAVVDWDGTAAHALREAASGSTAVIVFPRSMSEQSLNQLFGIDGGSPTSAGLETNDDGWEASPDSDVPAFRLFDSGEFGNPLGGRFRERARLSAAAPVLARFSDGAPAILRDRELPLLVANLSLDPAKSTWPTQSIFVPAMAEILLDLLPDHATENFEAPPGEPAIWIDPLAAGDPVFHGGDGEPLPLVSAPSGESTQWQSATPVELGLHPWSLSGQTVHYTAVNFPESESALTSMAEPPALSDGRRLEARNPTAALDAGLPLWPWLIALALLFLLAESLIAQPSLRPARS